MAENSTNPTNSISITSDTEQTEEIPPKNSHDDEALSTILLSLKSKTSAANSSTTSENENTEGTPATAAEDSTTSSTTGTGTATATSNTITTPTTTNETPVASSTSSTSATSSSTSSSTSTLPLPQTASTPLTPLPETVLPVPPPALTGAEVLDEAEYNRRMTVEYLRQYFHLPLNEVATLWGVTKPAFKKLCRQHGIKRWPSRQVSSIISSITMLQNFCQDNDLPERILKEYESRLAILHTSLEQIMQSPNLENLPQDTSNLDISVTSDNSTTAAEPSTVEISATSFPIPPPPETPTETAIELVHEVMELPAEESVLLTGEEENKKKRKRSSGGASRMNVHSPLDPHTGWIAECHKCGKLGKFRNVFEGRPFQHSTGDGKYCGYFRINPRKIGSTPSQGSDGLDESQMVDSLSAASTMPSSSTTSGVSVASVLSYPETGTSTVDQL